METLTNEVLNEYQNLIYSIAHQFGSPFLLEDLFQVGWIGLNNAYNNYDASYGTKFSTYAYPYIVGEMKKFMRENHGMKVSREITKLTLKIEKASILLSQRLMREPTFQELADFLDVPEFVIGEAIHSKEAIRSIDEPIKEDGKVITLHDTIGAKERVDLNTLIALREEISKLDPLERSLIRERYTKDQTQSETANVLGMSQVQVSRKEQKVLVKLKDKLAA